MRKPNGHTRAHVRHQRERAKQRARRLVRRVYQELDPPTVLVRRLTSDRKPCGCYSCVRHREPGSPPQERRLADRDRADRPDTEG